MSSIDDIFSQDEIDFILDEAVSHWNAVADEYNQWPELGLEEKIYNISAAINCAIGNGAPEDFID